MGCLNNLNTLYKGRDFMYETLTKFIEKFDGLKPNDCGKAYGDVLLLFLKQLTNLQKHIKLGI